MLHASGKSGQGLGVYKGDGGAMCLSEVWLLDVKMLTHHPKRRGSSKRLKKRLVMFGSTFLPTRTSRILPGSMRMFGSVVSCSTKPCVPNRWQISSRYSRGVHAPARESGQRRAARHRPSGVRQAMVGKNRAAAACLGGSQASRCAKGSQRHAGAAGQ